MKSCRFFWISRAGSVTEELVISCSGKIHGIRLEDLAVRLHHDKIIHLAVSQSKDPLFGLAIGINPFSLGKIEGNCGGCFGLLTGQRLLCQGEAFLEWLIRTGCSYIV